MRLDTFLGALVKLCNFLLNILEEFDIRYLVLIGFTESPTSESRVLVACFSLSILPVRVDLVSES